MTNDADDGQLCTRPTHLVGCLLCELTETTVCGQTCPSTLTHYSDSDPTSLCSFSLMQRTSFLVSILSGFIYLMVKFFLMKENRNDFW
jgi:hypothetical protein